MLIFYFYFLSLLFAFVWSDTDREGTGESLDAVLNYFESHPPSRTLGGSTFATPLDSSCDPEAEFWVA